MKAIAPLFALVLMLPACAGQTQMRAVSAQSAAILSQYRTGFVRFSAAQNQLNADNEDRLRRFERERELNAIEVQSRTMAWRLANREALARFETLTSRDAAAILASTNVLVAPARPAEALQFEAAPVEAMLRQLVALQRPRSPADQARDLLRFADGVRASYDDAVGQAAESTDTATIAATGPQN